MAIPRRIITAPKTASLDSKLHILKLLRAFEQLKGGDEHEAISDLAALNSPKNRVPKNERAC
jgi:hypothetical protein